MIRIHLQKVVAMRGHWCLRSEILHVTLYGQYTCHIKIQAQSEKKTNFWTPYYLVPLRPPSRSSERVNEFSNLIHWIIKKSNILLCFLYQDPFLHWNANVHLGQTLSRWRQHPHRGEASSRTVFWSWWCQGMEPGFWCHSFISHYSLGQWTGSLG